MLKSFGPLVVPTGKHGNMCLERRAIMQFCQVISPSRNAFHPGFLYEEISQGKNYPKGYFKFGKNVEDLLEKMYEKTLEKHASTQSTGPLPNRIKFQQRKEYYILQWVSFPGKIALTLYIGKGNPKLLIKGAFKHLVKSKALLSGLPEPKLISGYWRYPTAVNVELVPEKNELSHLLDVKVPLGDFLDFLRKYGTK